MSAVSHDDCVTIVKFFDIKVTRIERKLSERSGIITPRRRELCVQAADRMVEAQYGIVMADLFDV